MKKYLLILMLLGFCAAAGASTNEQTAYKAAKAVISPEHQKQVFSMYGKGTASDVDTWFVKFYDPSAKSNARVVIVEKGKVERFNTAEGQETNDQKMTFDPSLCNAGVDKALKTANKYAKESMIPVDSTRVYLNRPAVGKPPVWTVELLHENRPQGFIYANANDGAFVGYRPPGTGSSAQKSSGEKKQTEKSTSSGDSGKGFGDEVKDTFLGIGGDLEEFFTGERTVDD